MKKLFVAVLAIAALAACNKDNDVNVIDTTKKSVAITIANGVEASRAVAEVTPTANGGTATIVEREDAQSAIASTSELWVLFANNAGNVVEAYSFADAKVETAPAVPGTEGVYSYIFHEVHESVTQVAVVRYAANTTADDFVGTNLSVYAAAAAVEDVNADLSALELYAASDIAWDGLTYCESTHTEGYQYKLYSAELTVTPALARVEITGISCLDLGETTFKAASDANVTGGFDELALTDIKFGTSKNYTYTFADTDILKGVYEKGNAETKRDLTSYTPRKEGVTNAVIAWNIAPSVAYPSDAAPMVLSMNASAYDYTVNTPAKTLTINGLTGADKFERSKIYRMAINFNEENLDVSNESICVDVEVTVANWVVVEVTPTFQE